MTNNIIDKVRAEINRRIHNIIQTPEDEEELKRDFPDQYGVVLGYRAVLSILDEIEKEPVSEDLEEAATLYAKEEYSRKNPATLPNRCVCCYAPLMYAFKAGAQWQQERDEADRAAVYKCGWNDRKAMMMKKSFDAKILPANIEETEFCLDDYEEVAIITEMVNKGEFKMGDKVKVIVIKED